MGSPETPPETKAPADAPPDAPRPGAGAGTPAARGKLALAGLLVLLAAAGVVFKKRYDARHEPFSVPSPPHVPAAVPIPGAMVLIPGGTYQMGSRDGFFKQEEPVHEVTVKSFYLDETEVTVAAYAACARSGACVPAPTTVDWVDMIEEHRQMWAAFCNGDRPDRQDHPVNCLDWDQASAYCRAQGRRLPTEEEWEYVARGGSEQRKYPWGNDPPSIRRSNICGIECGDTVTKIRAWGPIYPESDGWVGTSPVGSFPEGNARWGIKDLHGNVQEWLSTPDCPYLEPGCPNTNRAARGSGWLSNQPHKVRSARRNSDVTWHRSGDLGVRCAKDAAE